MNAPIDETSLTAYALGELSGAERAAVAAHLVGNATARQYVADVRSTAHLLADELARESFGGLTDLQHAAIEQKLADAMRISAARPRVSRVARWNRAVFAMSLAASVMIVCGIVSVLIPFVNRHTDHADVAKQDLKGGPVVVDPANPAVQPNWSDKSKLHDEKFANSDETDPGLDVQYVPKPDNRLANMGSGHEETEQPRTTVGVHAPEGVTPAPMPPVARGPGDSPDGVKPPHTPTNNVVAPPIPKPVSGDPFAKIGINDRSPDKLHNTVEKSANGTLPTGEQYAHLLENPFIDTAVEPVSGFSAGVDTASYSNIRRFLTHGTLPPRDAVRIEEMLNYFPVRASAMPAGNGPLALQVETGACPWRPERRLARVCLQARELPPAARPPVNLVFLIDISDSMRKEKTKLPLLKRAIRQLVNELSVSDRVALVAYSHETEVILPPTVADAKDDIRAAIDHLEFGGQSRGGQGIEVAYDLATRNFLRNGVNRVVLATDGNWNIGITERANLGSIISQRAKINKVSLTVLGVGMDNLKDDTLQKLASAGNGSYAYIDTLAEARKVLDDQVNGALVPVARDVKVQVTFNPASASSYRLIGYERRALSKEELKSQSHPGGEIGAGQSVTALYEVIVANKGSTTRPVDMITASATYADPSTMIHETITTVGEDRATPLPRTSTEFRFSAAVAEFGLLLRDSDHKGNATYASVLDHAREASGPDETGYRREFMTLIQKAKALSANGR